MGCGTSGIFGVVASRLVVVCISGTGRAVVGAALVVEGYHVDRMPTYATMAVAMGGWSKSR